MWVQTCIWAFVQLRIWNTWDFFFLYLSHLYCITELKDYKVISNCFWDLSLLPSWKQFKTCLFKHTFSTPKVYLLYIEKCHQRTNLAALLITHCNEPYYIIKSFFFPNCVSLLINILHILQWTFWLNQRHNYVISMQREAYELLINIKSVD